MHPSPKNDSVQAMMRATLVGKSCKRMDRTELHTAALAIPDKLLNKYDKLRKTGRLLTYSRSPSPIPQTACTKAPNRYRFAAPICVPYLPNSGAVRKAIRLKIPNTNPYCKRMGKTTLAAVCSNKRVSLLNVNCTCCGLAPFFSASSG